LNDTDGEVRATACSSLHQIGQFAERAIPALMARLEDDNDRVRWAAAGTLGAMRGKAEPAIPALIAALKDKDAKVRGAAAMALSLIGPAAKAAIPALIEALRDATFSQQVDYARALAAFGPAAKDAVPVLVEIMPKSKDIAAASMATALGAIGPDAKDAVPALLKAINRGDQTKSAAFIALGKIGPAAKAAVPVLLKELKSGAPPGNRAEVADALGEIGPAAADAVPTLMDVARDLNEYEPLREAASLAVMRIAPDVGAKNGMETAHLNVRLGKVPSLKPGPRAKLSNDRRNELKGLIAKFAEIKDPSFGLSSSVTGRAFAPLPDLEEFQMGLLSGERAKTADDFRKLVEAGPDVLPLLLESLDDPTPTKLKVPRGQFVMQWFGSELESNPLNPIEKRVLAKPIEQEQGENDLWSVSQTKVGDVCFVAIGQIVGRSYRAIRYQPTGIVVFNSPVANKALCDRVRAIWSSDDPAAMLMNSLLIDYATEGKFNGNSLDGWDDGSERQLQAIVRLLYYFPNETTPLIAARLRSLDVRRDDSNDGGMKREVRNGIRTDELIKAVRWSKAPEIQAALADILKRTNDPDLKECLTPERNNRNK
jgi:HEAT repeat protein